MQQTTQWDRQYRQAVDQVTAMLWMMEEWNISLSSVVQDATENFRDERREKDAADRANEQEEAA